MNTCAGMTRRDPPRRVRNIETPPSRCASGLEPESESEPDPEPEPKPDPKLDPEPEPEPDLEVALLGSAFTTPTLVQDKTNPFPVVESVASPEQVPVQRQTMQRLSASWGELAPAWQGLRAIPWLSEQDCDFLFAESAPRTSAACMSSLWQNRRATARWTGRPK